jgi:hypothetical protein
MARNIIVRGWCPGDRVLAMDVVRGNVLAMDVIVQEGIGQDCFQGMKLIGDIDVQRMMLVGDVVFRGGCCPWMLFLRRWCWLEIFVQWILLARDVV